MMQQGRIGRALSSEKRFLESARPKQHKGENVAMDSDYNDDETVINSHCRPHDMHVTLANTH